MSFNLGNSVYLVSYLRCRETMFTNFTHLVCRLWLLQLSALQFEWPTSSQIYYFLSNLVYRIWSSFGDYGRSRMPPLDQIRCLQCWNWPKRTGEGGISCRNVWNLAQGLKFKADFHSKMSICRHELGIVAKRCVLEQKLSLTAYRKSYIRNRLVPKWITLTFV